MMSEFLQKVETAETTVDKTALKQIKTKLEEALALVNKLLT